MKELIENLKYLDIPRREGEVFLALLQKNEFTAPEISKITSVSRTKSYEILQNLVKKGLCNESYRNGIKVFNCVDPKIVIENILSEYEKKKRVADELSVTLNEIFKKNGKVESSIDYIEVLTDKEQIKEKWLTIQKNAKKELLGFSKQPYAINLDDNIDKETDMIKNEVIVKGIYEYKNLTQEERSNLIKIIEIYNKMGEEVRIVEELPMKMIVIDETITMLALNDRVSLKPAITTIVVEHPGFALAQKDVFNCYWQKGIPIVDYTRNQNEYLM
jgi:HTH-type transcriptional regulator, sugar sensing transcriptional regulator